MPAVTALEASTRLKAVNASMSFQLIDFDVHVQENANRTAVFYVGDRTVPYLWGRDNSKMVSDIEFDFM
ncbi:MAG: hypothetical protein ACLTBZ_13550 [Faecalispora jeddahensis]|jgi:glutaredoxin|uniref:hypothetical protein n=1 Tax=Eubacteriales TaxID=186802 RepID=UPI0012DE7BE4|nr:hypothetical protein [Clostridium sp. MSTE9]MBS5782206.1 hypothetical protein [Clostridium sp.]DAT53877.1 MAG TPA: hypothetical protein [Caudoviricetes sp.]